MFCNSKIPEISVIMSVYNEPIEWIQQSIDSILNQTFRNFEFIIINDNPDGKEQLELLHEYAHKDHRINVIENSVNIGLTKSLNIAIAYSKGKYIARMDADDISLPNRFMIQYEYMENHPYVDICGSWAKLFGNIPCIAYTINKLPIEPDNIKLYSLFYNPMIHPSMFIRTRSYSLPLYDEHFIKAQDYVLVGESIIQGKKLANIPQILIKYRTTKKSKEKAYVSQQNNSANYIRKKLLLKEFPSLSIKEINFHNELMSLQHYDLKLAESWLIHLKSLVSESCESLQRFNNNLFEFIWVNVCISNKCTYRIFKNSSLYYKFSPLYFLRFLKRRSI